jgi:plasmid stabilization system protein ParE
MARQVIWSFEAAADLEALAEFVGRDSPSYAAAFVQEILQASHSLKEFSARGRIVPEMDDPRIRELFVRGYRLIYDMGGSQIIILGVIHGKRDLRGLWEEEQRGSQT